MKRLWIQAEALASSNHTVPHHRCTQPNPAFVMRKFKIAAMLSLIGKREMMGKTQQAV